MPLEKMKVSKSDITKRKEELENIKNKMYLANDEILTILNSLINKDYETMDIQEVFKELDYLQLSARNAINQLMEYLGDIHGENSKYYSSLNKFRKGDSCNVADFMKCLQTHLNEISLEVKNIEKGMQL